MSDQASKECVKQFVIALREKNAAVFIGAGFSKAAGFVDWKELMRDTALDLGLDVDRETDLIAIAQYHLNERLGNRSIINQLIIEHFVKEAEITPNHRILADLPLATFWTTNYDDLIERSLKDAGKTPDVKRISENICITVSKRDATVYKMHGDITLPHEAVLTKEDYETYGVNRGAYSIVLQSDLVSKTFLFIGFSFDDPNLIYILNRIKNLIGPKNTRTHYCFFKKDINSNTAEIERKQELKLKDLNRYGIKAILINDYSEITKTLSDIRSLYNRSQIFISGAAAIFKEFGTDVKALSLIHNLSKLLVSTGRKVISGFGYQVGSAVINGALEYILTTRYRKLDEYLKLMPFPQLSSGEIENLSDSEVKLRKEELHNSYRELMISEAGIVVFLFGNKRKRNDSRKTELINSPGMYKEFLIAKEFGLKPIPIGATGYMAKQIWSEVMTDFEQYYGKDDQIKNWLNIIGDNGNSESEIIKAVSSIIDKLNKL